ncbi:hypothetical protein ABE438_17475 [Bosea sp. TWI1241]|uniref:hypothetical protein n=1 Tax=Bosea sp. TWI1241 TaxID=3148904 RepID=UPI00320ACCFB
MQQNNPAARRPGRRRKDPLKVRRDKAGRILQTAERAGSAARRQAQAQRFRQLGAEGVLDPRLGSTLGLMFVLGVPVKIGPQEYDAACWLADRLRAYDETVLALRRSPPSNVIEKGAGGIRMTPLELEASARKGRLDPDEIKLHGAALAMAEQVAGIRADVDMAKAAMGDGPLGRMRWQALTAACRSEPIPAGDGLRHFVDAVVDLAFAGGFYDQKRRRAKNQKQAWGHDVAAIEIIRVVKGEGGGDGER